MDMTIITSPPDRWHGLTWQTNHDSAFSLYFQATCAVNVLIPCQGISVELEIMQLTDCTHAVITKSVLFFLVVFFCSNGFL